MAATGCRAPARSGRVELVVFAASSLTEAFTALERGFEQTHPDVDVQLSFAGSQVLRVQLEQGAAADVFASADARHVDALAEAGLVAERRVLARNGLVVILPADNPAQIEAFAQLTRATRLVVGTPEVPIGAYTREVFARAEAEPELGPSFVAQLRAHVVSEESNVRLVRAKVELGEADAAFVYATDAQASTKVQTLRLPEALAVETGYPIATLARSAHAERAAAFLAYVASPAGRAILDAHGFDAEAE